MAAEVLDVIADDGCRLHVEQEGSGPALLLISGLGGKGDFWNDVRPSLAKSFRVVTFDHRGTGASDHPPQGYTIAHMVGDVLNILDALEIDRTHIVGHSTGGAIAQVLALDMPERVGRLVISASWGRPDYRFRLLFETRLGVLERASPGLYTAFGQLLGFPNDWINDNEAAVSRAIAQADNAAQEDRAVGAARIKMLLEHDRLDDLHRIAAPTLVVGAPDDMIVPIEHADAIAQRIPDATLLEIAGGHFYPRTRADLFARSVAEFLQQED